MFRKQREDELTAKRAEKERIEKERLVALKQKEVQRITEERRRNEKPMDILNGKRKSFSYFLKKRMLTRSLLRRRIRKASNILVSDGQIK